MEGEGCRHGKHSPLGDGFPLMVDANMKWSADEAIPEHATNFSNLLTRLICLTDALEFCHEAVDVDTQGRSRILTPTFNLEFERRLKVA